ncbi:histidine kinase [Natrinema versiforme JCM 10478]|uniref:histidine kinase n=1 Tax=Natrinema versiforme JCM 10478 TaxID=1227496 RepID=L9XR05_9EURY|nr:histidine kinase [Natrinema versiforme JCM 10478]
MLFLIAVVHHATEFYALNELVGPLVAVLLDGLPALGLVYAGYWLAGTDLPPEGRWRVFIWCLVGASLFVAVMGLSLLVRAFEGRVIGEALFPLLIAAEAGGIAGVIAGYYTGRARVETRRAQTMSNTLGFVNSLIRHDLRNDLSVIQGHADLIETSTGSGDTETEFDSPSIIAEKTDEALTRIDTTGTVANTLTGDADIERVDLVAITAEMATRIKNTYDLPVTIDTPDRAPVTANAGLRSVVDNLLENAVEHNDTDDPRIHVAVEMNTETVRLIVADNGPGIPDEQKEQILDSQSGKESSGGLSLVQILVEEYGGKVLIENNDPRGSIFTVELSRSDTEQQ